MRLVRRVALILAALTMIAVLAAGAVGTYAVRRAFPQVSGTLTVPGLGGSVEVIRDRWGIPHIYARSERDLYVAQGFVHAQDRLWQMELNRRTASGRLSEIFGEATLGADRFLRTVGLRRAAEKHLAGTSPRTRANLEAYAAGVNAYLAGARGRLPIEFAILRFVPEPWTPADTLVYGKLMAWVLGGDWRTELLRQQLIARFGAGALERLMPGHPEDAPVIAPTAVLPGPPAIVPGATGATAGAPEISVPWPGLGLARLAGAGSNNWVVGGDRSVTAGPLLANDPHLEAQMPSVWYLMHLSGGSYDVAGATFPGVPGVIAGHNRDIAWGVTNADPDVQDLFVERFNPDDPTRYLDQGRWVRATIVREEIKVKGRKSPVVETIRITRRGPVINNVVRGLDATLAIRWTALDSSMIIDAVGGINRASTWEEFREALRSWDAPSQNFVFAHRNGETGYQMPGVIPIRTKGTGGLPSPGWTGEFDWRGAVPFDALPSAHQRDGVIVTANNRIAPALYPYFLGRDWDPGFRARRIAELLGEEKQSVETFKRIHTDVASLYARAVVESLRSARTPDPALQPVLQEITQWDGVVAASSRPAAIYEAFVVALMQELFREIFDDALFGRYLRHHDAPALATLALLRDPASAWWKGSRDRVIEIALRTAVRDLEHRLGPNRDQWRWGRLHQPVFTHPIGRIRALAWIFNTTPPETGGDAFTVNNGAFDPEDPFRQVFVASYRQILDTADWDRSLVIHTTGQSGLPFHKHYRDFAPRWARGEYVPLLFSRARVDEAAAARLILLPR